MSFHGQHIWLIGASAGIGEALAKELAEQGATLALSARSEDKLKQLNDELSGEGHLVTPCDVSDSASLQHAFDAITSTWPRIDNVVYLAGLYSPTNIADYETNRSLQTIDVNVQGVFRTLGLVLPYYFKQQSGALTLFGSVAGYRGLPNSYDYCASKAAMNALAESLYIDLQEHNIKVQLVCPGFVETRLTDKNEFDMPFRISSEKAAKYIVRDMQRDIFESHFPKQFTLIMKLLRILPNRFYLYLAKRML